LKVENKRLQKLISELQRGEETKGLLFDENSHLRDYINRKNGENIRVIEPTP